MPGPPVAVPADDSPEFFEGTLAPQNVTEGMPPELIRALRDPAIRLPQDDVTLADGRSLWEHLEEWRNAPSNTAAADPPGAAPADDSPEFFEGTLADGLDICHICHKPTDAPGEVWCSASHPLPGPASPKEVYDV